jgi:hypothetical protein
MQDLIYKKSLKKFLFYTSCGLGTVSLICGGCFGAIFFRVALLSMESAACYFLGATAVSGLTTVGTGIGCYTIEP